MSPSSDPLVGHSDSLTEHGHPENPGSDAAVKLGCICPRMDNGRGDPEIGRIRGFVVVIGCPLHSPKQGRR